MAGLAIPAFLLVPRAGAAQRADDLAAPPPGDGPLEVSIGLNVVNITDIDEKEQTIDFDGVINLSWVDPRLAYAPADYGMQGWLPGDYSKPPRRIFLTAYAVYELFEGWWPAIVMPNGIGNRQVSEVVIGVWPDGRVMYHDVFSATAETPMDVRRFPFDRQSLEIFLHPLLYDRSAIVLVPDARLGQTWDQDMGIADWSREGVSVRERPVELLRLDGSSVEISEVVVTMDIERRPLHFLLSIFFPMIVLVSLTWCVFWMDSESLSNRVNVTFIGILSVVAYYFIVLESIPNVSYLTFVDGFIIATFLILAAGVVLAVVIEALTQRGRDDLGRRVDRICRWAFPLAYAITSALLGIAFFYIT